MTRFRKTVTIIGGAAAVALMFGSSGLAPNNVANGPLSSTTSGSSAHTAVLASGCILGLPPC